MNNLDQSIWVFAARYAHHRPTGAAWAVVRSIKSNWELFDEDTKNQLIRESHEATYNKEDWEVLRGIK
jgi:hypothetical protein